MPNVWPLKVVGVREDPSEPGVEGILHRKERRVWDTLALHAARPRRVVLRPANATGINGGVRRQRRVGIVEEGCPERGARLLGVKPQHPLP
eukprot:957939-Prymnesium_polylepis.2